MCFGCRYIVVRAVRAVRTVRAVRAVKAVMTLLWEVEHRIYWPGS